MLDPSSEGDSTLAETPARFVIRAATAADARAIGQLYEQDALLQQQFDGYDLVDGFDWTGWAAASLQRPGLSFIVAEHQGIVVAYVYGRRRAPSPGLLTLARRSMRNLLQKFASRPALGAVFDDWGIIDSLFVIASERRKGIARALVEKLQHEFTAQGVKRIEISVVASNPEAVAFWAALGYRQFRLHLVHRLEPGE